MRPRLDEFAAVYNCEIEIKMKGGTDKLATRWKTKTPSTRVQFRELQFINQQ